MHYRSLCNNYNSETCFFFSLVFKMMWVAKQKGQWLTKTICSFPWSTSSWIVYYLSFYIEQISFPRFWPCCFFFSRKSFVWYLHFVSTVAIHRLRYHQYICQKGSCRLKIIYISRKQPTSETSACGYTHQV